MYGYPTIIIKKIKTNEINNIQEHEGCFQSKYIDKINTIVSGTTPKKKIRKDAIVLCQCYITCNKEFFFDKSEDEIKNFFISSGIFLSKKFGENNIISQVIHLEEKPHMHFNFVPIVDGRLCAKDLFKKKDLYKLHDDFYRHNQVNNYKLFRDKNAYEKNKLKKTINNLKFDLNDIEIVEKEHKGKKYIVMDINDFNKIKESIKEYQNIIKHYKV